MNSIKTEFVILVDEHDNETGTMEKLEAHKKALLHRAISVFIFNSGGEWLLQRRALGKYHSNGLWTNTCCSHPFPGETNLEAANRRLMEEMGLKAPLRKLFHFTYKAELDNELTEHELDHVFLGVTDDEPVINPDEVKEWKYISWEQLHRELDSMPESFTFWFRLIAERVKENISHEVTDEKS
jgi:isopentenyl-diphosphate Delta-isomerase